jgi:hypothetical protein
VIVLQGNRDTTIAAVKADGIVTATGPSCEQQRLAARTRLSIKAERLLV